jgi:hypothetical protein
MEQKRARNETLNLPVAIPKSDVGLLDSNFALTSVLKMEAVCSSETLVPTHKSTRRDCPEDQHRHLHRRKNPKSVPLLMCGN